MDSIYKRWTEEIRGGTPSPHLPFITCHLMFLAATFDDFDVVAVDIAPAVLTVHRLDFSSRTLCIANSHLCHTGNCGWCSLKRLKGIVSLLLFFPFYSL